MSKKSVTVITPTIGTDKLHKAIESVDLSNRDKCSIQHLCVVDGPQFENAVRKIIPADNPTFGLCVAPCNTGSNGFYGHRIYAAYPHLVNTDYVAFLDEDNWYEPNHISSLVELIESKGYDWAHSLRNIMSPEGDFLVEDNCESIGKVPIYWSMLENRQHEYLVDTSSYLFKTEFLVKVCNHWHHGWGGDRRFFNIIHRVMKHDNFGTTGLHTLNYRLDADIKKKYGSIDFFIDGNRIIKQHYGEYPWKNQEKTSSSEPRPAITGFSYSTG